MFDVSGRTSVFCVGPNPLWQKIANVKQSMTIWTSTILSGPVLQKNANGNRNPCKATLRKSSSGTASRSAWVAKSSSLEACYMTSQAWLFQKPWHFSWKKTNLVNCNQGWLHREFISHSIGFLEFFEILPLHPLPPSLQSQSSGIRKTIAIHPLAQILFINPGIAISS